MTSGNLTSFHFCLRKTTLLCSLWLVYNAAFAQSIPSNPSAIHKADSLYYLKQYKESATLYFEGFNQDDGSQKSADLFNAAKACAKAHMPDSTYKFLAIIAGRRDIRFYDNIISAPDFKKLYNDRQWNLLAGKIVKQQHEYNAPVARELVGMYQQRFRSALKRNDMLNQYGSSSAQFKSFDDSLRYADTLNYLKLRTIINTYGWPGPNVIGQDGVSSLIYLYQHTDHTVQKRYFPLVVDAFKRGDIDADNFAVIADRVSLFDTGKQIYGTQAGIYPIENKDSVNNRRISIGLKPVQ